MEVDHTRMVRILEWNGDTGDTGDTGGDTGEDTGDTGDTVEDTVEDTGDTGVEEEPIRRDFPIVPSITAHCDQQKPLCPLLLSSFCVLEKPQLVPYQPTNTLNSIFWHSWLFSPPGNFLISSLHWLTRGLCPERSFNICVLFPKKKYSKLQIRYHQSPLVELKLERMNLCLWLFTFVLEINSPPSSTLGQKKRAGRSKMINMVQPTN